MVFNTFTTDVDADKNAKEEIVTEDGVVIEDGGWGSSSEDNWVITDWAEVKIAKITVPELVVPEYIPKGYDFHSLTIEDAGNITRNTYIFKNDDMQEYTIQECIQDENLGSTQINNGDRQVNSKKGVIYIEENQKSNNAIICIDDSIIVYIWSTFTDKEIVKIVDNMTYQKEPVYRVVEQVPLELVSEMTTLALYTFPLFKVKVLEAIIEYVLYSVFI